MVGKCNFSIRKAKYAYAVQPFPCNQIKLKSN